MLFPLNPHTPLCKLFQVLNDELLYFLKASITAEFFDENLFRTFLHNENIMRSVCWSNIPTREKFQNLWNHLPIVRFEKAALYTKILISQNIHSFFDDTSVFIPTDFDEELHEAFKALTTHLFTKTKDIKDAITQAGETIEQHFQSFSRANNGTMLCYLCGTSLLSQNRIDLNDDKQWRADYDHVLCKDKYPIYSVHPKNFIPTCHICNSKAKGARDLLKNNRGQRRIAFYPLPPDQRCCHGHAAMELHFSHQNEVSPVNFEEPLLSVSVTFQDATADITQKIDVWKEVYQVPSRVEEHVKARFFNRIISDLAYEENNFDDFKAQLVRLSRTPPRDYKETEWRIWWYKVYQHLASQNEEYLIWLWSLLELKQAQVSQADMQLEFGDL
jgi:hypothetical protein